MQNNEVFLETNNFTEAEGRIMDPIKRMEEKMEESKNEEQPKQESNWLSEEAKNVDAQGDFGEKLPSPVFSDGKITIMNIDARQPFQKWTDPETKKTKAIIPCTSDVEGKAQKCNWWVNLKNPIYKDVIHRCQEVEDKGGVLVKILQSGTQDKTRYTLIKE